MAHLLYPVAVVSAGRGRSRIVLPRAAALRVLAEERIFLAEFDCGHIRNIPTFDWAFPASSSFYHLLSPKGGAKSVRRAKNSGTGRRLAPKTLRGRARARVFDGASAARSSSRFFAMRRQLCALRNGDLFRFEFFSSHLAGLRPAGMHCENSGSSDGIGASARSGSAKQRSLLCPLSERGCRHPLLFAVLDLSVLLA